ncbi:tyrosine-type recombinase/integrase [Actinomadura scrupuli]|uniref:tyrosine-type recombinase/integrase n=1 Tax=Actinomadura scrupuli TaxID=559629 RepID=UPI003D96BDE2
MRSDDGGLPRPRLRCNAPSGSTRTGSSLQSATCRCWARSTAEAQAVNVSAAGPHRSSPSTSGGPYEPPATPRRRSLAARWNCPGRWRSLFGRTTPRKRRTRRGPARRGRITAWSSARGSEPRLDAGNIRRSFRTITTKKAKIGEKWTPRELRHSFVSIMSDKGVPIETIADLCGHAGTAVTEQVYRHQLKPVITKGAETMNAIFGSSTSATSGEQSAKSA